MFYMPHACQPPLLAVCSQNDRTSTATMWLWHTRSSFTSRASERAIFRYSVLKNVRNKLSLMISKFTTCVAPFKYIGVADDSNRKMSESTCYGYETGQRASCSIMRSTAPNGNFALAHICSKCIQFRLGMSRAQCASTLHATNFVVELFSHYLVNNFFWCHVAISSFFSCHSHRIVNAIQQNFN